MTPEVKPSEQWLFWELLIQSKQMDASSQERLCKSEPAFAAWLQERAEAATANDPAPSKKCKNKKQK